MKVKINLPPSQLVPDLVQFFRLLRWYIKKKLTDAGFRFEKIKDFFVDKLLWRRGRLSRPFLTSTFFMLVATGIVIAPIVKSRYPTLGREEKEFTPFSQPVVLTTSVHAVETTTQESEKPRDRIITYKVKKGDTITSIAQKFFGRKDQLAIKTILWENNLSEEDTLTPDQEIRILPVPGVAHRVAPGETIYSIAKKYNPDNESGGTNPQKIVEFPFNEFLDDETFALAVSSGEDDYLIIPDGIKPEPKPKIPPSQYFAQVYKGPVEPAASGIFSWPLSGGISQFFSWWHRAIDITQDLGVPITAAASGRVAVIDPSTWGYGYHVIIDHGNGFQTLYAHLSDFAVSIGQSVSPGQTIGHVGLTGLTTGPHLHFEIRQNGVPVNPLLYLPQ